MKRYYLIFAGLSGEPDQEIYSVNDIQDEDGKRIKEQAQAYNDQRSVRMKRRGYYKVVVRNE